MVLPKSSIARLPTIYDVAREAGVSHQTVSRFLKGETGVKAATRVRIEAAILSLDYRPNSAARALATNRSFRIGALVYELQELGPSHIAQGASDQARESGYLLDIVALDPRDDRAIAHAITLLDQSHLAGIIALAPTRRMLGALKAADYRVPIVIDTESEYTGEPDSETLNSRGTKLALEHLIDLGHTKIGYIAGPPEWISAGNRLAAYRHVLETRGFESFDGLHGDWTAASGYAAGLRLPLDVGISAVLVANDQMAMGVLRALSERGVRVPREMSVVGFDDIPESEFTIPPLTTVRLNFAEQGRLSVETLIARIENRPAPVPTHDGRVSLVVRHSTGPAPQH